MKVSIGNRFLKRLKEICSIFIFELFSYLYSIIGLIKTRFVFRKDNINKLEIGAGKSPKKSGFITSDLSLKTDFPFDLRMGLPFPDESIDLIYAEHVIEHFNFKDLIILLNDCYRVLKNRGILSLAVPNIRIWVDAYYKDEELNLKKYCGYIFGLTYKSKIDYLNYIFYMDGQHRHMFDEDSMLVILRDVGFKDAHIRDFNADLDQEARRITSIYAEAIK